MVTGCGEQCAQQRCVYFVRATALRLFCARISVACIWCDVPLRNLAHAHKPHASHPSSIPTNTQTTRVCANTRARACITECMQSLCLSYSSNPRHAPNAHPLHALPSALNLMRNMCTCSRASTRHSLPPPAPSCRIKTIGHPYTDFNHGACGLHDRQCIVVASVSVGPTAGAWPTYM